MENVILFLVVAGAVGSLLLLAFAVSDLRESVRRLEGKEQVKKEVELPASQVFYYVAQRRLNKGQPGKGQPGLEKAYGDTFFLTEEDAEEFAVERRNEYMGYPAIQEGIKVFTAIAYW